MAPALVLNYFGQGALLIQSPEAARNPFYHLAISYQEILFFPGPFGHWKWLAALGAASVVFFVLAYWTFDRLRDSFAEEV